MKGRLAGASGHLIDALGVAALFAPHDNDGIHLSRQTLDFGLAFFGGVTDGIVNVIVGYVSGRPGFNRLIETRVLGGLGHDDGFFKLRQLLEVFERGRHVAVFPGIALEADHFRVIPVADDDRGIALGGVFADDGLNADDPGASGVDHLEPGGGQSVLGVWRNTMGPNQYGAAARRRDTVADRDAFFRPEVPEPGGCESGGRRCRWALHVFPEPPAPFRRHDGRPCKSRRFWR